MNFKTNKEAGFTVHNAVPKSVDEAAFMGVHWMVREAIDTAEYWAIPWSINDIVRGATDERPNLNEFLKSINIEND
jgi:hypothetical protein